MEKTNPYVLEELPGSWPSAGEGPGWTVFQKKVLGRIFDKHLWKSAINSQSIICQKEGDYSISVPSPRRHKAQRRWHSLQEPSVSCPAPAPLCADRLVAKDGAKSSFRHCGDGASSSPFCSACLSAPRCGAKYAGAGMSLAPVMAGHQLRCRGQCWLDLLV